eukprot:scaffold57906_cov33-Tisochrysis_lutea.AAC.1
MSAISARLTPYTPASRIAHVWPSELMPSEMAQPAARRSAAVQSTTMCSLSVATVTKMGMDDASKGTDSSSDSSRSRSCCVLPLPPPSIAAVADMLDDLSPSSPGGAAVIRGTCVPCSAARTPRDIASSGQPSAWRICTWTRSCQHCAPSTMHSGLSACATARCE